MFQITKRRFTKNGESITKEEKQMTRSGYIRHTKEEKYMKMGIGTKEKNMEKFLERIKEISLLNIMATRVLAVEKNRWNFFQSTILMVVVTNIEKRQVGTLIAGLLKIIFQRVSGCFVITATCH